MTQTTAGSTIFFEVQKLGESKVPFDVNETTSPTSTLYSATLINDIDTQRGCPSRYRSSIVPYTRLFPVLSMYRSYHGRIEEICIFMFREVGKSKVPFDASAKCLSCLFFASLHTRF